MYKTVYLIMHQQLDLFDIYLPMQNVVSTDAQFTAVVQYRVKFHCRSR